MKILYAASECTPFVKTGGLADVAGTLPVAMARQGATYPEILLHYYTGVEIADMRESGLIDS